MRLTRVIPLLALASFPGFVRPVAAQFTVTKVVAVVNPKSFTGDCPTQLKFTGTIFVSRHPVTVYYQWERSDGGKGPRQSVTINAAGEGVTDTWTLGAKGAHLTVSQKLHVLAPTGITSAPVTAKVSCNR
jgi:hypothetical protein